MATFERALIALKDSRIDEALQDLTVVEKEHPDDARVHIFRGVALVRLGRYGEATAEYREAIRINPRDADAYRNLGFLEWTEHRLDEACETLKQAIQLSPADEFAHYYLGRTQLDKRNWKQAFSELTRSGMALPSDVELLVEATTGYIALGERENARDTLDRLSGLSLTPLQISHVAALFAQVHEERKALQLLYTVGGPLASERSREYMWVRLDAALIHLSEGSSSAAVEDALQLTGPPAHLRPAEIPSIDNSEANETANAWSVLGIAYAREGAVDRAVEALKRAVALAPTQEEHWLNLTRELMEGSRYAEAIASSQAGLASIPRSYALHLRLGAAYLSAGRYADSEAAFRELVVANDPLLTSYVGLAQVLLRTGHADEAVAELAMARQRLGPSFLLSYFEGLSLSRNNQRGEAAVAFKEALNFNPDSPEAHLGLGEVELSLGEVSAAIAELQMVLSLSPKNKQARRLLRQAYYRSGETNQAAQCTEEPENKPVAPQGELLGDFLLPPWQDP